MPFGRSAPRPKSSGRTFTDRMVALPAAPSPWMQIAGVLLVEVAQNLVRILD